MGLEMDPSFKKDYRALDRMAPTTDELLGEVIDGEYYAYQPHNGCLVCDAGPEVRRYVDDLLLFPKSQKEILKSIQPLQEKLGILPEDQITSSSIRTHYKKHLPLDKIAVREIIERRASEKGRKVIDSDGQLLTPEGIMEVIVAKGFEDIVSGEVRPTLSQTMQAVGMLERLEKEAHRQYKPEILLNQLNVILLAIREVLPDEWRDRVFNKINEYSEDAKKLPTTIELNEATEYIDDDLLD